MKDPAGQDPFTPSALTGMLLWLREPRAGRVAAIAGVVALAMVLGIQVAVGGA